jgi:protein SCO1
MMVVAALLFAGLSSAAPRFGFDLAQLAFQERPGATLPQTATLHDSDGRPVRLGDLARGLPLIVVLGYFHCPNLCGVVRASLYRALDATGLEPGRDYALAAISIDPTETVGEALEAKLRDAASFHAARPERCHYLVTTPTELQSITAAIGFRTRRDATSGQLIHAAGVVFTTAAGKISSYLLGVGYRPDEVRGALALARSGLAAHTPPPSAAPTPSPILLICFHFDPATGRYTLDVLRAVQFGALLTSALLAILVFRMARTERAP